MKWKFKENYYESVSKWENIISILENSITPNISSFYRVCGFCAEAKSVSLFGNHIKMFKNEYCSKCALFLSKKCSNVKDPDVLFWKIIHLLFNQKGPRSHKKALEHSKEMLAKIKECAPE